jgi:hypothetical protein
VKQENTLSISRECSPFFQMKSGEEMQKKKKRKEQGIKQIYKQISVIMRN